MSSLSALENSYSFSLALIVPIATAHEFVDFSKWRIHERCFLCVAVALFQHNNLQIGIERWN